jgi:signal transduction histidine kinase
VIANANRDLNEPRETLERAALRRVASLVAAGVEPHELFTVVAEEVGRVVEAPSVSVTRYEFDETMTVCGKFPDSPRFPIGTRVALDGHIVANQVRARSEPARLDDYSKLQGELGKIARSSGMRSSVGAPIVVAGRLWGLIIATSSKLLPDSTEARLSEFTELLGAAIANAEARDALARIAGEQAALRRIATLVAQGAQPEEVFTAVAEETATTFDAFSGVLRFTHEPPGIVVAGVAGDAAPIGTHWELVDGMPVLEVYRTNRSARTETNFSSSDGGELMAEARRLGIVSHVCSPILVDGRVWGVISVSAREKLPPDTEQRLEKFTELVSTAIANAESKAELAASRRRIVAAGDEVRRRISRDLHDGTQQRLVSLGFVLRSAKANLPPEQDDLRAQLSDVAAGLIAAVEDLREITRGIHPAILAKGGLGPALRVLADRSAIPVDLTLATQARLAEPIEVAAYYVASEALANAAKHSQASRLSVSVEQQDGQLLLSVRDDGIGGADSARGSGLVGLTDRIEALGGSILVSSPSGGGTQITAVLPLEPT